jgi:hypothetical protein
VSRAILILSALVALAGCTVEQRYETIYLERGFLVQTDQKTGAMRVCEVDPPNYGPVCSSWRNKPTTGKPTTGKLPPLEELRP